MTIFQAIIYGIVQGISEFLPISSSAHLIALPKILGWEDPGLIFDVALHLGTLVAVVLFFYKDWINLIKGGIKGIKTQEGKLFWYIVLASIPGAIVGKLCENYAESIFRNLALIGTMLIVMGIILYFAEKFGSKKFALKEIGWLKSFLIGVSQTFAIIPGVSRSGVTMSSGLLLGLTKESTAKFSFLLSTPIILGAGLLKMKDIFEVPMDNILFFIIGMLVSAITGFLSIKFLLNYLKNKGFGVLFYSVSF